MSRRLVEKALYRHFKGGMYAIMFVSKSLDTGLIWEKYVDGYFQEANHTETGSRVTFFDEGKNGIVHRADVSTDTLVVYVSLDTGKKYARPIDMFLSEVDKEKYPDIDQQYRFELVEGFDKSISCESENDTKARSNLIISDNRGAVVFGDGKIAMTQAKYKKDDAKFPALILSELDEPHEVGESYKHDKASLTKDLFFIFKSKESIEALQLALEDCKKTFNKEKEVEQ